MLQDVLITEELARRPTRRRDPEAENRALHRLARELADRPAAALDSLVVIALDLCAADSAGVSLLDTTAEGQEVFRWVAVAGKLAPHVGCVTPRDSGTCAICVDRDAPQLFRYPERHFAALGAVGLPFADCLVLPFHMDDRPVGAIWIVAHDPARTFDTEDVRVMTSLAELTAAALRLRAQAEELAVSRERVRVASELHDTLNQMLFSVALKLDWCQHHLPGDSEEAAKLAESRRELGTVMGHIRRLIGRLSPEVSPPGTLADRLHTLFAQFREVSGVAVELVQQGDLGRVGPGPQNVLYKTFQEGLANVAKHARATRVRVEIDVASNGVQFAVADDGVGPEPGLDLVRLFEIPRHFGLRQMRERVEAAGGRLAIGRLSPSGFHVTGVLPAA